MVNDSQFMSPRLRNTSCTVFNCSSPGLGETFLLDSVSSDKCSEVDTGIIPRRYVEVLSTDLVLVSSLRVSNVLWVANSRGNRVRSVGLSERETECENRTYPTWWEQVSGWFNRDQWECRCLVSDGAKALVKLALSALTCPNLPDVFHLLYALSKSMGSAIARQRVQLQGATKEDIIAFIKRAKTKKPSPKSDVCKNFDNTKLKPVLPDDAPIAVVLFAGGGGIEAGIVQAGIRPVIAVEFDPTKIDLSRAVALNHHRNFSEYGCRIIQLTVQEVARLGFLGFKSRPDYLHASPVCANFSQAHTAKAGKGIETADDLSAAIAFHRSQRLQP